VFPRYSKALLPVSSLVYFLEFTNGFPRFLGPTPRKDDPATIIQNDQRHEQQRQATFNVLSIVYTFDARAPFVLGEA